MVGQKDRPKRAEGVVALRLCLLGSSLHVGQELILVPRWLYRVHGWQLMALDSHLYLPFPESVVAWTNAACLQSAHRIDQWQKTRILVLHQRQQGVPQADAGPSRHHPEE